VPKPARRLAGVPAEALAEFPPEPKRSPHFRRRGLSAGAKASIGSRELKIAPPGIGDTISQWYPSLHDGN
jgi:hypothetical protein